MFFVKKSVAKGKKLSYHSFYTVDSFLLQSFNEVSNGNFK